MVGAMSPVPVAIGVDLGGTFTKSVVLDGDRIVHREQGDTDRTSPARAVAELAAAVASLVDRFGPVGRIGVTVPGHVDDSGVAVVMPNLPGAWRGVPVLAPLEQAAAQRVSIVNDARAFGRAETVLGVARGARTAIGLVLGTGIGGVVIVDSKVHLGAGGQAGEIGHQVLDPDGPLCGCGNHGCLESLARADVIAEMAGQPTMAAVAAAAKSGDPAAVHAVRVAAAWIGRGIANVLTVLQPEIVFLGGGVAQLGETLFAPIRSEAQERSPLVPPDSYRIVAGALGAWAGAIGAALPDAG